MAGFSNWRIVPNGDQALNVVFGERIADDINRQVLAADDAICGARAEGQIKDIAIKGIAIKGIVETVPCYASLLVHFDCRATSFAELKTAISAILAQPWTGAEGGRRWRIPAFYGDEFGDDLAQVARLTGLVADEVISRHVETTFRIAMLGFTPGFAYLSGLNEALNIPRRTTPRPNAPAGSLSIAAGQAAIQCLASPTGWHVIGRTPVRNFDPLRNPVFLFEPGDFVSFVRMESRFWPDMEKAAGNGEWLAEQVLP